MDKPKKPAPPPRRGRGSLTIEARLPKTHPAVPEPILSGDPAPDVVVRIPPAPPVQK